MYRLTLKHRRGWLGLVAGLLSMTLLFGIAAQPTTYGQADGILPSVIFTTPTRGDELPVQQDVTFTFNVPMNRQSVVAAFRVTPEIPGNFNWTNAASFTYQPTQPFERGTAYIFEIDSRARSVEGVPLREDFSLKLTSAGYLTVTQFFPTDTYWIELQPAITLVFNRPVVPLGTAEQMQKMPAPFTTHPEIEGKGEWLTTSVYTYKPAKPLKGDTEYTLTIPETLKDVTGVTPKEAKSFKFRTRKEDTKPTLPTFAVKYNSPENDQTGNFLTRAIWIAFETKPDQASVEAAFTLRGPDSKPIKGRFDWKRDGMELYFYPEGRLDYSTPYTYTLDRNIARSAEGKPLYASLTVKFWTINQAQIVGTSPENGALISPTANVWIYLSSPMNDERLKNYLAINPTPDNLTISGSRSYAIYDINGYNRDLSSGAIYGFRLEFTTLPSTTYTITIDPKGIKDRWGSALTAPEAPQIYRKLPDGRVQFQFRTAALGEAMSLETGGHPIGLYNAYHQTRVFVTHRNIDTIGMTLNQLNVLGYLNPNLNNEDAKKFNAADEQIRRWVVPVYNPPNIMRYDLLAITGGGVQIGQAGNVVCVEGAPSHLNVGQQIRVVRKEVPKDENATPTAPDHVLVRNQPGLQNTAVVGQAVNGAEFTVTDGPVCADRYVWWAVQSADGALTGWIPEGDRQQPYVVPIDAADSPVTAAAPPKLAPGLYRLTMDAPDIPGDNSRLVHTLLVATENITLKLGRKEAFAWLTDLKTGRPAAGLPVQFYRHMLHRGGEMIVLPLGNPIMTDANGIAHFPTVGDFYPADEVIYAAVEAPGHFAFAASNWTMGIDTADFNQPTMFNTQDLALYLYTDRRLYRRGDVIYFRGTLRQREDAMYRLSAKREVPVEIFDPFDQVIYSKVLPLNEFGTFADSFTLDSGGQLGEYRIVARPSIPQGQAPAAPDGKAAPFPARAWQALQQPNDPKFVTQITVADYIPPEYRVALTAAKGHYPPGEKIKIGVESSYYFGGAVAEAFVSWQIRTDPYYFFYSGPGNYSFEDYNQDAIGQDYEDDRPLAVSSGKGRTDADGRYQIEVEATLGKSRRSLIYTVEATVSEPGARTVSERTQIVVDQGLYQVGVGVDRYVGASGQPQTASLITVDSNSKPLPNTSVTVRVVRREWANTQTREPGTGRTVWENAVIEKEIAVKVLRTGAAGKATFDFTPMQGGAYKIYALSRDKAGNLIRAATFLWVAGPGYVAWRAPNSNRIDLQADKVRYTVGDVAEILIPTPFQGESTALVTVERGGILKTEIIRLESNSAIYKLPITPDMAPSAFVSVTVIKGEDATNFTAAFRTGLIQLIVETDQLRLNVKITSDKKTVGPQQEVTYNIQVTDYKGEPVRAEVGLALVDEAILALMPDDLPSLMAYFYSRQGLGIRTANALIFNIDQTTQEIINVQKGGGKGGSDYFGIFTIRKNYIPTPLWNPSLITDLNGEATVKVKMPDQLTTFVLDARAYSLPVGVNNTTLVGQATHSLTSTKPLMIRPEVPRFYVQGDTSVASAIVNNNTVSPQEVVVRLEITGAAVPGELVQYATIPPGKTQKFDWPLHILDVEGVDMTFKVATRNWQYSDAAKPITGTGDDRILPVLRYETPDTVTTGGVIGSAGGSRTEGVIVPSLPNADPTVPDRNRLNLRVERSLASGLMQSLYALDVFPHSCVEQTVSRFLPNAIMLRAKRALGLDDSVQFQALYRVMETTLQRLYSNQQVDGGWGWFVSDRSDQLMTAYVVLGLVEAQQGGWRIDYRVVDKAVERLRTSLKDFTEGSNYWDMNRQAFVLYVLARASQPYEGVIPKPVHDVSRSVMLFNLRDKLNLDAKAFLALTFAMIDPESGFHRTPLIDDIKRAAKLSPSGYYWQEKNADAWNWTTDTRTTAIILKALVETEPTSDLIPGAVRWLMAARQFDRWETTQETAWSVMALTAYMEKSGDFRPSYTFTLSANDKPITDGQNANPENVNEVYDLRVPLTDLLAEQVNRLKFERSAGDGNLYYTAQLQTYLPVAQVKAVSRGIYISRTYSLEDDPDHKPITMARQGDRIRVTLTIIVPEAVNYAVIEDPLPAGTESIDTSLQTSQRISLTQPLRYGLSYWVFTHTELRDDKSLLYAPYLPQGTYQFIYQLRAGAPGKYHVLPANGRAFYTPEIFGRTDGSLFEILPEGAPMGEDRYF